MRTGSRWTAIVLTTALVSSAGMAVAARATQSAGNDSNAAALGDFSQRIRAYVDLHRRLEGPVPSVKVSDDPAEIRRAMDALAERLQLERAGVTQGNIFSPQIAVVFKRLVREGCGGHYGELLAIVTEEMDHPVPPPLVNRRWPAGAPFSMMPPDLLCTLPALPPELQYRFIYRDLVLWDMHADLIVDFITNAIPPYTDSDLEAPPMR